MPVVTLETLQPGPLRRELAISREAMARLLEVSAKSVERWEERGTLPNSVALRQRLAQLREILALAHVVFEPDGMRTFMGTPMPALGGRTPLQAIAGGDGDRVLGVLATLYEGAAV